MRWISIRYRHLWLVPLTALALARSPRAWAAEHAAADVQAQRVAEAEALAERAYEAYVARDHATAIALYHQSFELMPSADALFNIARIYDIGLRDRVLAISFYRRYLSDPGASPDRIARASQRLTELRLAERAELDATAPAAAPAPSVVAPAHASPATSSQGSGLSGMQVAAIATGATGAVAASLGAVFGVTVLSDAKRANADCADNRCRSQLGVDASRAASRHATLATWGIGAGAGLMAAGALLWVFDPGSSPKEPGPGMHVDPMASDTELGLALSGRW